MRILTVSQLFYPDTVGGSERVLYEQSRGLVERGHQVTVLVQRARRELADEEIIDGIRVLRYGHPGKRFWLGASLTDLTAGVAAARRLLRESAFDVAVLHHPSPAHAFFKAAGNHVPPALYVFHASVYRELLHQKKERKRPVTQSVFGSMIGAVATPLLLRRIRDMERGAIARSQRVVVLSDFSKQVVQETYHVPDQAIIKIPGGVDLETYRPHPSVRSLRQQLHLPDDRKIFLTIRRLVPRMGIEELLYAAAELFRSATQFHLYIGGTGPERERLQTLTKKLGIQRFVTFLGFVKPRELPDYYAAADLFVLPTVAFEGFGIATLEALASGTPVLGTPVGASPEIIRPLDPRLLTRDASASGIAEGMRTFLAMSPQERETLRRSARALVETTYPWSRSLDLLENTLLLLKETT
jgi:glycosyltransferase involved in cell wall biosynthesis